MQTKVGINIIQLNRLVSESELDHVYISNRIAYFYTAYLKNALPKLTIRYFDKLLLLLLIVINDDYVSRVGFELGT